MQLVSWNPWMYFFLTGEHTIYGVRGNHYRKKHRVVYIRLPPPKKKREEKVYLTVKIRILKSAPPCLGFKYTLARKAYLPAEDLGTSNMFLLKRHGVRYIPSTSCRPHHTQPRTPCIKYGAGLQTTDSSTEAGFPGTWMFTFVTTNSRLFFSPFLWSGHKRDHNLKSSEKDPCTFWMQRNRLSQ